MAARSWGEEEGGRQRNGYRQDVLLLGDKNVLRLGSGDSDDGGATS